MKFFLIPSLLFCLTYSSDAQIAMAKTDSFKFLAKPDSVLKKTDQGYIYLSSDTSSKVYNWIVPNPNNELISSLYGDYIEHIKKSYAITINIFNIGSFPKAWNSVYRFNNNFVLYGPSDWMHNSGYYISDSVIYITSSDPSDIFVITDFQKTNSKAVLFKVVNYEGEHKTISIELLNQLYGIYLWNIKSEDDTIETKVLMQNSEFSKKLPIIISDCGENKCLLEFDFANQE